MATAACEEPAARRVWARNGNTAAMDNTVLTEVMANRVAEVR